MRQKALDFATQKHAGQVRRSTNLPYIIHPVALVELLRQFKPVSKNMDTLVCACYLHDTLEDTETTFIELVENFSPLIASIVLELTNDSVAMKAAGSKLEYQKKKLLGMSSYALTIKLLDRLHNISDQPTKKMVRDTVELIEYIIATRRVSDAQWRIIQEIAKECNSKV